jgi:CheY-like chemotaxis protein
LAKEDSVIVIDFKVLVLDDDEGWLARHERRLRQAGIDFRSTQSGAEAIKIAKTDPTVKFALIDEILYALPRSASELGQELQHWQGSGVIRQIVAQRSDLQVIMVTAAPKLQSNGNAEMFRRETTKLRRQKGVIDIVHKVDIEEDPEGAYSWMIDLFKRSHLPVGAQVITPKVLIGLGFSKDIHEAMAEQIGISRRQYLPIERLLQQGDRVRLLNALWDRSQEKSVLLEMPGSKTLDLIKGIRPESSAFQILAFLAQQAEMNADLIIHEHNYKHTPRKSKKPEVSELPDYDPRSVLDYASTYHEDGRRGTRFGVQIEGKHDQNSPLKVAMHRLKNQLSKLNVGPANQLFLYERDGYRPQFELGIVVYALKATAHRKSLG